MLPMSLSRLFRRRPASQLARLAGFYRRRPAWALCIAVVLGLCLDSLTPRSVDAELFSILGTQPWGPWDPPSQRLEPRVSVLETDAWKQSLKDGSLRPVPHFPLPHTFWGSLWNSLRRSPPSSNLLRS